MIHFSRVKLSCLEIDTSMGRIDIHLQRPDKSPIKYSALRSDIRKLLKSNLVNRYVYCAVMKEKKSMIKLLKRFGFNHITDYESNGFIFHVYIRSPNYDVYKVETCFDQNDFDEKMRVA